MMRTGWSKKGWPALAGRVVPPLVEVAALAWTRHRHHKASRHIEHQASQMESLAETLSRRGMPRLRAWARSWPKPSSA